MVTSPLSDTSMAGSHCSVSHSSQVSRNGPSAGTGVIPAATNASETRTSSSPTPLVSRTGTCRASQDVRTGPHGVGCRGAPACTGGAGSRNCSTEDIDRPTWWAYSAPTQDTRRKPGQLYVHVCVDHAAERAPASPVRSRVGALRRERGSESAPPTASRACQPSVLPFRTRCAAPAPSSAIGSARGPCPRSSRPRARPHPNGLRRGARRRVPRDRGRLGAAQHQPPNAQRWRTWLARTATPRAKEPVATPGRRWGRRRRGSAHGGMMPWPGSRCRGE